MRMIPGKVRQAGKALYQAGEVVFQGYEKDLLLFQVLAEEIHFSASGGPDYCSCSDFGLLGYCVHIAAVEIFMREQESTLMPRPVDQLVESGADMMFYQEGEEFLLDFLEGEASSIHLHLGVEGEVSYRQDGIIWTFKLRYGDSRYYIIRDISELLTRLARGSDFRLSSQIFFEALSWELFDVASQDVLAFLLGIKQEHSSSPDPYFRNYGRYLFLPLSLLTQALPFFQDLEHFQLDLGDGILKQVWIQELDPAQSPYQLILSADAESYRLDFKVADVLGLYEDQLLYDQGRLFLLSLPQAQLLGQIRDYFQMLQIRRAALRFHKAQLSRLFTFLEKVKGVAQLHLPEGLEVKDFSISLFLDIDPLGWIVSQSTYQVGDGTFSLEKEVVESGLVLDYQQTLRYERALEQAQLPTSMAGRRPPFSEEEVLDFFDRHLPALQEVADVSRSAAFASLRQEVDLDLTIEEGRGYLEVNFSLEGVDQQEIQEAVQALTTGNLYRTKAGRFVSLSSKNQKRLQELMAVEGGSWEPQGGPFQVKRQLLGRIQAALEGASVTYSKALEELLGHLAQPETYPLPAHPILEQLRDYQRIGVAWMSMLVSYGFGGILADDMGLGKTVQAISFLLLNLKAGEKALVVTPSGLLYNWQEELRRFAPELKVSLIYGSKQERAEARSQTAQVYLTSYGSLRQDILDYRHEQFQTMILDEAQYLKNQRTKVHTSLQKIEADSIFALSGTPVENRLEEIGAIFNLVLPGLLPAKKDLLKMPVEAVAQQIRPFILRRDKQAILTELPEKSEGIYVTELLPEQKSLYLAQRNQMQAELQSLTEQEFRKRKVEFLAGLTRLRQICDSPALFLEDYQGQSGKLELLKVLLERARESGQRILIFSQFVGMLELVQQLLDQEERDYFMIRGSTPARERQEISRAFNQGQGDVVLISLKAGGVGLNLTGADTVFLLDLWWNPAVEEQAIGRAHRMGQQNAVQVYRFITKGSIEEKIFELQESKRNLLESVLNAGRPSEALSLDEVKEILGI